MALTDSGTDVAALAALGLTTDHLNPAHAAVVESVAATLDKAVASIVRSAEALRLLGEALTIYGSAAEHLAAELDAVRENDARRAAAARRSR